jgi:hypothetical protein
MSKKHETIKAPGLFYAFVDFGSIIDRNPVTYIVPSEVVTVVIRTMHAAWLAKPQLYEWLGCESPQDASCYSCENLARAFLIGLSQWNLESGVACQLTLSGFVLSGVHLHKRILITLLATKGNLDQHHAAVLFYLIRSASLSGSKTPFWSLLLSNPASDTARMLTSTLPAMSARFAIAFHAL